MRYYIILIIISYAVVFGVNHAQQFFKIDFYNNYIIGWNITVHR